jgi:hypothetical protein
VVANASIKNAAGHTRREPGESEIEVVASRAILIHFFAQPRGAHISAFGAVHNISKDIIRDFIWLN